MGRDGPTTEQMQRFQALFAFLNDNLFSGSLPAPMLTQSRIRAKGCVGFFAASRWHAEGEKAAHEIALTPLGLARGFESIAATLAHEMVHLWQAVEGKPSRDGYHNREWAQKMLAIGLAPSATGAPGGATTGQRMSHYIVPGGHFARALEVVPEALRLRWRPSVEPAPPKSLRAKSCYVCAGCGIRAWGKPGLHLWCADCRRDLSEEG